MTEISEIKSLSWSPGFVLLHNNDMKCLQDSAFKSKRTIRRPNFSVSLLIPYDAPLDGHASYAMKFQFCSLKVVSANFTKHVTSPSALTPDSLTMLTIILVQLAYL